MSDEYDDLEYYDGDYYSSDDLRDGDYESGYKGYYIELDVLEEDYRNLP